MDETRNGCVLGVNLGDEEMEGVHSFYSGASLKISIRKSLTFLDF